MAAEYNFQAALVKSIINADAKLDRRELLIDIFKAYVAKLFELKLSKGERLPYDALVQIKRNLINEFRQAELAEYQQSIEWYENLFDKTVEEILNDAAARHQGIDTMQEATQVLSVHAKGYAASKGMTITPSGLVVPG
jgi:hypothetical protein